MVARAESLAQEVFATTTFDIAEMTEALDVIVPKKDRAQRRRQAEAAAVVGTALKHEETTTTGRTAPRAEIAPRTPGPKRMRGWYRRRQHPRGDLAR